MAPHEAKQEAKPDWAALPPELWCQIAEEGGPEVRKALRGTARFTRAAAISASQGFRVHDVRALPGIAARPCLKELGLNLTNQQIKAKASALVKILGSKPNLTALDLSYVPPDPAPKSHARLAQNLASAVGGHKGLQRLDLTGRLGAHKRSSAHLASAETVAHMLRTSTSLTSADLSGNRLGHLPQSMQAIGTALRANDIFAELILKDNDLGLDVHSVVVVADVLHENTALRKVDLGHNVLSSHWGGVNAIVSAVSLNTTLTWLGLSDNGLEVSTAYSRAVADMLRANSSITFADLSGNWKRHYSDRMRVVLEALRDNRTITSINLSNNRPYDLGPNELGPPQVDEQGNLSVWRARAPALAGFLRYNLTVTDLDISRMRLGFAHPIYAWEVAYALCQNRTITTLKLGENGLGDGRAGAAAVAWLLSNNATLTSVDLSGNALGNHFDGGSPLVAALRGNSTLARVDLRNNNLSDAVKDELRQLALETGRTIWV